MSSESRTGTVSILDVSESSISNTSLVRAAARTLELVWGRGEGREQEGGREGGM